MKMCYLHCAQAAAGRNCAYVSICGKVLDKLGKGADPEGVEVHYVCNSSGMRFAAEISPPSLGTTCQVAAADDRDARREYAERAAMIVWRERLARALFCSYCDRCDEDTLAKLVYEPDESKFDLYWLRLRKKTPQDL
jgi:hypothetical protein